MKESVIQRSEPFLLEIGSEEIPARFLRGAEQSLGERLEAALRELRLLPASGANIQTFSTPRRLVAWVPEVLFRQEDQTAEVIGPPVRIGFDAEGNPTRAAESFAQRSGVTVEQLVRVATPKGEYVAARQAVRGRGARELLAEALPGVVLGIEFPKSMYWTAKAGPRFIRPIRWLLAIQGEGSTARVIPFEIAGVTARNFTYGHRVAGGGRIRVHGFEEFARKVRERQVELDPRERRERVEREVKVLLEADALRTLPDPELLDWIVNSTEWPRALAGGFDPRFLALPREILVTVMRDHQKYFAVEDGAGNLQPRFVTVLNLETESRELIRQGHERVLAARFSDAEFFWNADQKKPLTQRAEMLERVTYQAQLGSYGDKVRRMGAIAAEICAVLEPEGILTPDDRAATLRAVLLSKCDLTTQMVAEFPELQGVVGGLYALAQGEAQGVADAVYEHYRPRNMEDACPRGAPGSVVSLADKLDSVVAGFAAGLEPTGSSDPFGLRRAGNGVIKIAVESLPKIDPAALLESILKTNLGLPPAEKLAERGAAFLRERTEFYLQSVAGLRYDTVRAVVRGPQVSPSQALERGRALEQVRDTEDFQALAAAAKRTRNILEKSALAEDFGEGRLVNVELLRAEEERSLHQAYQAARHAADQYEAQGDYAGAFRRIAALRPFVDRFFDKVLVMDSDRAVRGNRLRLLAELLEMVFARFADLAQIESTALNSVGAPTSPAGQPTP